MSFPQSAGYRRRSPMLPLPEAIILVLAPFAPLFSHRVWRHAQVLLSGAMLTPGPRTVTAAVRVMGLAMECRFTNYHRVLNRASWSARQGSRILLGLLLTVVVPPGATIVLGVDEALGPGALEPAGVGVARFDRALLAREEARPTTAQNQRRLGAADDETG